MYETTIFKLCGKCRHMFNARTGKIIRGSYQEDYLRAITSKYGCIKCDKDYWIFILDGKAKASDEAVRSIQDDEDYED